MLKIYWIILLSFFIPNKDIAQSQSRDSSRILFVGNSLTYVNDLPSLIRETGSLDGVTISYTSFLYPDYSLKDHWNESKVKVEIEKGTYDFVIAQQGPSGLPESQILLSDYAKRFSELCNNNQEDPALPLYSEDDFHPSVMGSLLSALVIYGSLLKKDNFDFIQYSNCPWKDIVSEKILAILIRAALKAMGK